jgi:hypothetical protein
METIMLAFRSPLTSQISNSNLPLGTPVRHNDQVVGFLVKDRPHLYRFAALDEHFNLLDGSRFTAPHGALAAVDRLSRFIDRPLATNEA